MCRAGPKDMAKEPQFGSFPCVSEVLELTMMISLEFFIHPRISLFSVYKR